MQCCQVHNINFLQPRNTVFISLPGGLYEISIEFPFLTVLSLESENQILAITNNLEWPVATSVAIPARILVHQFSISTK